MTLRKLAEVHPPLLDNHGRIINYLRLAVTDRCNLRCTYCMPANGLEWIPRKDLLSNDEILRLCRTFIRLGIEKIRITGGEPFIRKDLMQVLADLTQINGLKQVTITTNGVLTEPYIPDLEKLGIKHVNLSLDTLDRERFKQITRRDELHQVLSTLDKLLLHGFDVKLNAVVMDGKNTMDILPLVELTKSLPLSVRFIEEMPFNGDGHQYSGIEWDYMHILRVIKEKYPDLKKLQDKSFSTSYNYQIPGFKGSIGVIAAYTRSFCGTCNRIRITPQGRLKTCLYANGSLDLKKIMQETDNDTQLETAFLKAISNRAKDGWEAENARKDKSSLYESMATIGG